MTGGKKRFHISIAYKLIAVTLLIVVAAIFPLALKTTNLFREVFGKREEDANRSQAQARASEIELLLKSIQGRAAAIGTLGMRARTALDGGASRDQYDSEISNIKFFFDRERDLVSLRVLERAGGATKTVIEFSNGAFFKTYKLPKDFLADLDQRVPPPSPGAFSGSLVTKNRSTPGKVGLLSIGLPLVKDAAGRVTAIVLVDVDLSDVQRSFDDTGERNVYLVDKDGGVVAHGKDDLFRKRTSLAARPSVHEALSAKMTQGQKTFYDKDAMGDIVAAFSRTSYGLAVISEASESVILAPAKLVRRESLLITLIVVSVSVFVITLFSATLTSPIEKLVKMTGAIARGNFDINPTALIRSRDEVGTLAEAFGSMVHGLKEREKVKALFNKFHGSTVTESLLRADQVSVGGTKRNVAVLFSDIRGFTSFSESKAPEEVVAMLNEYFGYMVAIIHENHGVVDKFIGDAIMAIWGAPQATDDDAFYAVKAAIEMRRALAELNEKRLARGQEALRIGVGLHMGEAIAGTIGSENRMEYTVIGNTVNTASRIEAATKAFGVDILLSEEIAALVKEQFLVAMAGKSAVKGRTDALALYNVRGYRDADGREVIVETPYSEFEAEGADKVKVVS